MIICSDLDKEQDTDPNPSPYTVTFAVVGVVPSHARLMSFSYEQEDRVSATPEICGHVTCAPSTLYLSLSPHLCVASGTNGGRPRLYTTVTKSPTEAESGLSCCGFMGRFVVCPGWSAFRLTMSLVLLTTCPSNRD